MSLLKMFSVYDSKVEAFMVPFFMKSKGEAIRSFTEVVNDGKSMVSKYPADYTLFELGDFCEGSAAFGLHATPISVGLALDFVNSVS